MKDPSHPVSTKPAGVRVQVFYQGEPIADSREAVALSEARYPVVYYLPRKDVNMERLVRSSHRTHCPYKGEAAYYSLKGGPENAVWTYETPLEDVAAIKDHLAFYPDKLDVRALTPN